MILDAARQVMKLDNRPLPGVAWFAGAKAGLTSSPKRTSSIDWDAFFYDIREMLSELVHMEPAEPGTAPQIADGFEGSKYDVLGGYASISAWMTEQGLSIPVSSQRVAAVKRLLAGVAVKVDLDKIVIPQCALKGFSHLVPLKGPILQEIEKVTA